MNILPFVSAFIILFSAGVYTFFHHTHNAMQERYHYYGAFNIERQHANALQKKTYEKLSGTNLHPKNSTKPEKKHIETTRDIQDLYPQQKLNIRPLFSNTPFPQLETVALTLLKNLYQNTALYYPHMEKEILEVLCATIHAHPSIHNFEALLSYLPSDKVPIFYKLIKGTQTYTLYENSGYPPLGDFITLSSGKTEKPVHICIASQPLLEAIFGSRLTQALMKEERQTSEAKGKKTTLTKEEFQAFFLKCRVNFSDYESLFDYSSKKSGSPEKMIQAKDQKMQIKTHL